MTLISEFIVYFRRYTSFLISYTCYMVTPRLTNERLVTSTICTLNKKSLNQPGDSMLMVLHSKVLVQWMNFHSVNKVCPCSMNENSFIEQGLSSAAPWAWNFWLIQGFFIQSVAAMVIPLYKGVKICLSNLEQGT